MSHPALADGPIYLDHNATTPVDPRAVEAALPYLTHHFGNPSSSHTYAAKPRIAVAEARHQVAGLLGAAADEITFTAGGSEADNLAIRGAALAARHRGNHIITQATEHPAVLEVCHCLTADGFTVTRLPVDQHGRVDPVELEAAITDRTVLVSIMAANGETGTLQPVRRLAAIAHQHGALVHTDAAQAAGKIPLDVTELGVDLLTIAGHKLYAPKGIGALYIRTGTPIHPIIHGGGQEHGLRSGTENVAFIVALGTAAGIAAERLPAGTADLAAVRDLLHDELDRLLPGVVHLNGHPGPPAAEYPEPQPHGYQREAAPRRDTRDRRFHRIGVPRRHRPPLTGTHGHGHRDQPRTSRDPAFHWPLDHSRRGTQRSRATRHCL
jgi:cysteine desulfurase